MTESDKPFAGVRVVELAQWVFVPVAGALLADWGADVIHIEPVQGDPYRALATQGIGMTDGPINLSIAAVNRGKRSIAVDVRSEGGRRVLDDLLANADVFLTNLRPGALRRLGLDAVEVRSRYPRMIFARGHGYGARGPDADLAGYDMSAFWARGGVGHVQTPQESEYPLAQRGAFGDRIGGVALAFGVAGALLKQARTGQGSVVDVSLLGAAMWAVSSDVLAALQGQSPGSTTARQPPNPVVATYRTKDARHIQLVFLESDRYWPAFCRLIERDDLVHDPRFADLWARGEHAAELIAILDDEFARRTFDEWKRLLAQLDAPWAPVQSVHELLDDPQVEANGYLSRLQTEDGISYTLPNVPVQFDEAPAEMTRAPELGEHTEAVLLELGYTWEQIAELQNAAIIP